MSLSAEREERGAGVVRAAPPADWGRLLRVAAPAGAATAADAGRCLSAAAAPAASPTSHRLCFSIPESTNNLFSKSVRPRHCDFFYSLQHRDHCFLSAIPHYP